MSDAYNADERLALRRKRMMEDLVGTEAWKELVRVVESQIATRERIVLSDALEDASEPLVALLKLERVKGAIIGLRLFLENPHLMIGDGKAILAEARGEEISDEDN